MRLCGARPGLLSTFELSSLSLSWPISQPKEVTLQETITQRMVKCGPA